MKWTQAGLFVLVCFFFIAAQGSADTFYVATPGNGGNNGNPGSQVQPWATIQWAVDHVSAGDTIIVTPGTYAGARIFTSGTIVSPVTLHAQPGVIVNADAAGGVGDILEVRASYVIIDGFEITDATRSGISVIGNPDDGNSGNGSEESLGVIIRNNNCHDNGRWGIFTGYAKDLLIENNETSGSVLEHGIYVSNSSDNPIIRYNTVHHNLSSGIQINADPFLEGDGIITNAVIDSNIIYENGQTGGGGAAINLASVRDSLIANNLLYNNHKGGIAGWDDAWCEDPDDAGCDQDFGTRNNKFYNNTVIMPADGRTCISLLNASINNEIKNNILIHPTRPSVNTDVESQPGINSNFNLVTNVFCSDDDNFINLAAWQALGAGHDQNSIVFNNNFATLFVNTGTNDYHILTGSQAHNAGTDVSSDVDDDLDGTLRPQGGLFDIGAYEFIEACPGDTTDPTTSITAPPTGNVEGDVQITADADDDCAVVKVDFYLDAVLLGTDTSSPYSFTWDTSSVADGTYVLTTVAHDPSGNTGTSAGVSVTVENPFLFFDNFEDQNYDGWVSIKPGWSVVNGDLTGATSKKLDILSPNGWGGCTTCTVEADLQVTANGQVSLLAWYVNKKTLVEIMLKETKNVLLLKQKINGLLVTKQKASVALNPGQSYHVAVTFNAGNFTVALDGTDLFTVAAGATPSGIVGFRVKAALAPQATGGFEEIFVTP